MLLNYDEAALNILELITLENLEFNTSIEDAPIRGELLEVTSDGSYIVDVGFTNLETSIIEYLVPNIETIVRGEIDGNFEISLSPVNIHLNDMEMKLASGAWMNLMSFSETETTNQIVLQIMNWIRTSLDSQGIVIQAWEDDWSGNLQKALSNIHLNAFSAKWKAVDELPRMQIHLDGKTGSEPSIPLLLDLNVNGVGYQDVMEIIELKEQFDSFLF